MQKKRKSGDTDPNCSCAGLLCDESRVQFSVSTLGVATFPEDDAAAIADHMLEKASAFPWGSEENKMYMGTVLFFQAMCAEIRKKKEEREAALAAAEQARLLEEAAEREDEEEFEEELEEEEEEEEEDEDLIAGEEAEARIEDPPPAQKSGRSPAKSRSPDEFRGYKSKKKAVAIGA